MVTGLLQFFSQVLYIRLFENQCLQFAKVREKITEEQYSYYISELLTLPEEMQKTLEDKERIQWFAAKYANAHDENNVTYHGSRYR